MPPKQSLPAVAALALLLCAAGAAATTGCTRSQGYWKNHHEEWPLPPATTATCGLLWVDILDTPAMGNAWFTLAYQAIAAQLNPSGLLTPAEATALADATALLDARCTSIPMGDPDRAEALALKDVLEAFNLDFECNGACITRFDVCQPCKRPWQKNFCCWRCVRQRWC